MISPIRPCLVLAVSILGAHAGAQQTRATPAQAPFFAARITEFWQSHGLEAARAEDRTFDKVLERCYVRLQLGLFDLRHPAALLVEKNGARDLQAIAVALLDTQARWLEWVAREPAASKDSLADIATLKSWVQHWKLPRLATAGKEPERDLIRLLAASPEQVAAGTRLAQTLARGTALGLDRATPPPTRIVLSPTRRHFVEFVGFLGTVQEFYRDVFWTDTVTSWTDLWLPEEANTQVIALQYAAPGQKGDFTLGMDMNAREKTGQLEHVVQRAMFSLVWNYYGLQVDPLLQAALAQNMVVALYGENNARSGGSGQGAKTEGIEAFIPGAPGQGGGLPATNADCRWRLTRGADFFQRALRQAQKAGAAVRDAGADKDKVSRFVMLSEDERDKHVVKAPFLGRAARAKDAVPATFLPDYLEFYRAYRGAFLNWVQTSGAGNPRASAQRFGELLRRLATPVEGRDFETACHEVYGISLGGTGASADSLEGRFLAWLATQK